MPFSPGCSEAKHAVLWSPKCPVQRTCPYQGADDLPVLGHGCPLDCAHHNAGNGVGLIVPMHH